MTTDSPRSEPRLQDCALGAQAGLRVLRRSQWTKAMSFDYLVKGALGIQKFLDKDTSEHSGPIWDEVEGLLPKCFLIKCCWFYEVKS